MPYQFQHRLRPALQTSPWIILGSTAILLIVVIVLAVQNTNREEHYMSELLTTKGAALIRAVEAGARTGMMGTSWGGRQVQQLLEETARLPDVLFMAVVDRGGRIVAHSDPSKIGTAFRKGSKIAHIGPDFQEDWELVNLGGGRRAFEVHRYFRPLADGEGQHPGGMAGMMRRHGMISGESEDDWFAPQNRERLIIVVGLDVTPFEEAARTDIRTTIVLSAVLLVLGFGGLVSLFWMQNYYSTRQSLRDTSAFADEVVAHLPVGLIATDRSGRITFFNAAAEKITGLSPGTVKNKEPDGFLPASLCGLRKTLDSGATITEQEMECRFAGARTVPVSVSAARIINELGDFVGEVIILRDLGEVRRLQEEVRRQEKLAALGGLAAGVAHEIRNPLSAIKGLATFFAGQFKDGSEAREAAGVMVQEVDRLNRVITELLEFARPTDLKLCSTDLGPLLSRSLKLIQQDAAAKSIRIELNIGDGVCAASIDPDRLIQCLLNLYLNAIEAMDNGGVLAVDCSPDGDEDLQITISDTGRGIAHEHLGKIFDPYFTTKNTGTGLGLAIVHKIIEAQQGRIKVESVPGRGSTFAIQLPCRSREDP
jgi:two-component system, NtrC family, sensor histidine kinase HydH